MIKIVTDTTSVLSREYCQQHDIEVVPQIIRFGEETFLEGVEMDEPAFLQRLKSSAQSARHRRARARPVRRRVSAGRGKRLSRTVDPSFH